MRGAYAIGSEELAFLFASIDNGSAVRINRACFVDGNEDEFRIEFWLVQTSRGERIYRTQYNGRTTITTAEMIADTDALRMLHQLLAADLVCTVGIC